MPRILDTWDRFEISILRLCRAQYLIMAVLGAVAIVGGAIFAVVGAAVGLPTRPALPPEVAPQPPLNLAQVEQLRSTKPALFDLEKATAGSLTYHKDPVDVPDAVRTLFPDPPYAWEDVTQEYCRVPSGYGCLEKAKKIAKPGIHRLISSLLGETSDKEASQVLAGVRPALSSAPVAQRAELFLPAGVAYFDAVKKHEQEVAARQEKVDAINEKHAEAVRERTGLKAGLLSGGFYGIAAGISAMLLAGLFLAFLAVERHLREIRDRQV